MIQVLAAFLMVGGLLATAGQTPVTDQIFVALTDTKGAPLSSKAVPAFEIRIDDIQAEVLSTVSAAEPLALVLIVEGVQEQWTNPFRKALRSLVAAVREDNPASRVGLMLDPGPPAPTMREVGGGGAQLEKEIARFVGGAQTVPVLESISVATKSLQAEQSARRIVIAIAAGESSNHNVGAPSRALSDLRQSGASLWALDLGWSASQLGPQEERVLFQLARLSGGRHEYALPSTLAGC